MLTPTHNLPNFCASLLHIVRESAHIRRHLQLFQWLQGDVQSLLPHDILIAAWGDFSLGLIQVDVVSSLPAVRTRHAGDFGVLSLTRSLFNQWYDAGRRPIAIDTTQHDWAVGLGPDHDMLNAYRRMRTATVHGIKDERGQHDCLYIAMNAGETNTQRQREMIEILLPHIDMAMRQVPVIPAAVESIDNDQPAHQDDESQLSDREQEIMEWVRMGKTNYEIGIILNISTFTVKNHMRRILRRLNVANRAQAVSCVEQRLRPVSVSKRDNNVHVLS